MRTTIRTICVSTIPLSFLSTSSSGSWTPAFWSSVTLRRKLLSHFSPDGQSEEKSIDFETRCVEFFIRMPRTSRFDFPWPNRISVCGVGTTQSIGNSP
jgi:hypothetical protein